MAAENTTSVDSLDIIKVQTQVAKFVTLYMGGNSYLQQWRPNNVTVNIFLPQDIRVTGTLYIILHFACNVNLPTVILVNLN